MVSENSLSDRNPLTFACHTMVGRSLIETFAIAETLIQPSFYSAFRLFPSAFCCKEPWTHGQKRNSPGNARYLARNSWIFERS